ncbi:unnamed protein product [Schistosoma curassoni]|uniref:C2H2-type domain-containing protein n=1 Tax=Schistosoma curassoni TaxID=6186 RepID=A0A183KCN8_9TREM|nr:unnamed protein product [Schistosoma curassoni]
MLISSIVGGPTLIGRSVVASSMLGGFSGAGRFKSSLKCSTHLFRCSSMLLHIDAHSDMDYPELVDEFPIGHFPHSTNEMKTLMQANDEFIQKKQTNEKSYSEHSFLVSLQTVEGV